jgi:hypothetical protein
MRIKALLSHSSAVLALLLLLAGAAWAQDPCAGALILQEGPSVLGSATGCGVIITVTAVDPISHVATAFSVAVPNGGNGNPYDGTDDTLVGIVNNSGSGLTSITLTSSNLTFGGAFAFNQDGPCDFALANYNTGQDCFDSQFGYEGPDNSFSNITGPFCGEFLCGETTGTVNFPAEGGLASGATSWFALEGTPSSLTLEQQAVLTFTPTQTSAVATFNCASGLTPCPDPGAHSMKFSLNSVSQSFSITLLAAEVDGDGVCESGIPGDVNDPIDCRFVRYFGEPPFNGTFQSTNVPLCYAYSSSANSAPFHCVFYSVQGAPPDSFYTGPVLESIAWNTLETPPTGYVNSPRMYDDPSDDLNLCSCYPTIMGGSFSSFPYSANQSPYNVEDNQFVFDITTFFNPNPGTVGTDPTTGGKTKTFNDFVIAFPLTIAQVQQPVNSDGSSVFSAKRGVVPLKFNLLQDGVATCNLPPATLSLSRLSTSQVGTVDESTYAMAADSGSSFRISGCQYIYNLAASAVGVGQYKVGIMIGTEVAGIAYFELK